MIEYLYLRVSHSENKLAVKLSEKLEAAGYKVWLGQSGGDGEQQQKQAAFAIERSDAFVLGLSPELLGEAGLDQEVAVAQAAEKPIFLAQLRPVDLPGQWESRLAGRKLVGLSGDFEAGVEELLALLAGQAYAATKDDQSGEFFGGAGFGKVAALPGEQIVWSEFGLYWFKKWKTLVRVLVTMTGRRLIFFWDERDIWKWRPRESDELDEAFPMIVSLDQITAVGEIYRPKSFLIFATGKPYVDVQAAGNQVHRFSLETDFEGNIDALRKAVTGEVDGKNV